MDSGNILEVQNLVKHYAIDSGILSRGKGMLKAVDDVSFSIKHAETLGLVGESGCGKTTIGKTILRLLEATSGKIIYDGRDVTHIKGSSLKEFRKGVQFIFQDPYSSLNSRLTVGEIVGEPFVIHKVCGRGERRDLVVGLLESVGLNADSYGKYPHEFSGGQRQRIGIARALALGPKLVVCDEPVSALDVSIQSQILNLMIDLQRERQVAYLFISHGLAAVKHISRRIGVMYLGKIVELADTDEIFANPLHPYTQALLSAIPIPSPGYRKERIILEGDVPSPINPPSGCRFRERCRYAEDICAAQEPEWREFKEGHYAACHFAG